MARILGVGIATLDIINTVTRFPEEDTEVRACDQVIRRGGNTTNTLILLSQLGHQCSWLGTLADDGNADLILKDLSLHQIDTCQVQRCKASTTPTSYITLNQHNGSRTIVHYRKLDELDASSFIQLDLNYYDWIHFEARNIEQTALMLKHLKTHCPLIKCSVEFEKARSEIESLYPYADLMIFSKNFCMEKNQTDPADFINSIPLNTNQQLVLTWGDKGAYSLTNNKKIKHHQAEPVKQVIDSIGAGDSFNAGLIDALNNGMTLDTAISLANKLAGFKITRYGFDITDYER